MNLSQKRKDAAHTLVVPYDATPEVVNAAYERRLTQRFHLQNIDKDAYLRGNEELYNARVRMTTRPDKQWIAQLRLMATSRVDKMMEIMLIMMELIQRDSKSHFSKILIDDLKVDISKMHRKYKIMRGVYIYELGGLLSMMTYNTIKPHHDSIVPLVVYGALLVGAFGIGALQDSIKRSMIKISAWSKLLSYDKLFEKQQ